MFYISSERLKLIPLTHNHLQLWAENRLLLDKALGFAPASLVFETEIEAEITDALQNFWLPQTAQHPEYFQWFTNWDIVLLAENRTIGGIGLAGLPNETGESMVGYGISKYYQTKGYATEALSCLMKWAFANPELKAIVATTPPDNQASQKVLVKNGFLNQGEQESYLLWRRLRS